MIINGKIYAKEVYERLKKEIEEKSIEPAFSVILVGENPASKKYIEQKQKWAKYIGVSCNYIKFDKNTEETEIIEIIKKLNIDKKSHGIFVQLPVPKHINSNSLIEMINPLKDIDGLHPMNQGKLISSDKTTLIPCTPKGILHILEKLGVIIPGKNIVIVGRSNLVGKPIANLLINSGATVTVCNSKTPDISVFTKKADIVIMACGQPEFLTLSMIHNDTIVIDVGFTYVDGKILGDAKYHEIEKNGNSITPVPGGVGAMTVAMLMQNILQAYHLNQQ